MKYAVVNVMITDDAHLFLLKLEVDYSAFFLLSNITALKISSADRVKLYACQ